MYTYMYIQVDVSVVIILAGEGSQEDNECYVGGSFYFQLVVMEVNFISSFEG
ncbi:MAG: hypothetical protein ACI90V_012645 [Bacillariaceae sp.]|jgi:hypothetical protein